MKKRNNLLRKMLALMLAVMICCTMLILPASAKGNPAAEAAKAVVRVVAVDPVYNVVVSYGSAFGIGEKADEAPEYFITNWHVAHTDTPIPVEGEQVVVGLNAKIYLMKSDFAVSKNLLTGDFTLDYSQLIPCDVVYPGQEYPDMAILRSAQPFEGRTTLPIRLPSEEEDRGNIVYALGYPAANDETNIDANTLSLPYPADIEDVSITTGVFSHMAAMKTMGSYVHIETDARVNAGNSGGPLIDEDGNVIGINTYTLTESNISSYYAVSSQYIISKCDELQIPYRTAGGIDLIPILIIAAAALAVILVIVIVIVALQKNKKKAAPVPPASPVPPVSQAPAGLQIYAENGVFMGKTFTVNGLLKFGRSTVGVCFPGNTAGVSGEHCQIYQDSMSGQYFLVDMNSTYGTYVNNLKVAPNTPVALHTGVVFYLGSQEQTFRVL